MARQAESERWQQMRGLMPVARSYAYFDHAAVAPLPAVTGEAVRSWVDQATQQGDTVWPQWSQEVEQTRQQAASLIGASPDELALVPNTTSGISLIAEGLDWKQGDNVVTPANEFPSNLYPWMNLQGRGVEHRPVPVTGVELQPDALLAACDRRTRLIAVSWVGYATGWRIDLAQLVERAQQRGILVLLDAIQGLGVFPLDVSSVAVDFLAADGHKWLLGPEGAGILYVRSRHLERLRAWGVGWHSVVHAHDFSHIELNLRPTAARFEGGSQNMVGFLGLGASLRFLSQFGLSATSSTIAERVLAVTDEACEKLRGVGATIVSSRRDQHRSGIVAFELPGHDPLVVKRRCLEAQVVLTSRHGWLRISPHAYQNQADLEQLVDTLLTICRSA